MRRTVWVEERTEPGTYSVRYYDPETGKACRVPVESFVEMKAKKIEIETMLLNWTKGSGNPDAIPSVVFERYLESLLETHRPGTISLKRFAVTPFLVRVRRMGAINEETITDWKIAMVKKYKNDTVGIRLRELRAFLNWCVKKKHLTANPMAMISIPPSAFVGRRLTPDEIVLMYKHCDEEFRPYFVLLMETGARNGEILLMETKELDMGRAYWEVPVAEGRKSKHGRVIPLSPQAVAALDERLRGLKEPGRVFAGWTVFKVKYHWGKMLARAKIIGRVRRHDARHSFASSFKGNGDDLMAICGWKSEKMRLLYKHTTVEELRAGMNKHTNDFGVPVGVDSGRSEPEGV